MKGIHIILLVSVALHLVSANCNSQPCNINNCNSQPCNSNNCNSQPCNSNNCNSQSCNSNNCNSQSCNSNNCNNQPCNSNNCNSRPCNSNSCNSQPCNSNNNCNQQPCNVPVEESEERVPVLVPFPNNDNQSNTHSINNTNINNSTTTITLTNTINTVNNISVPISLNSTNENTISVNFEASSTHGMVGTENLWDSISSDCCLVTTPVNCTEDGKNCTMLRRRECSDICRGIFPEYDVNIPRPRVVVQQPAVQQPIAVQQPVVQQPVVQQPVVQRSFVVQQPVFQQPFVVQQPPVMFQQPTVGCGSTACGQTVQQPMVIQQPFAYPVYQPAQTQQVYIRVPVGVNQRPASVAQNVIARQFVAQPQQSIVEGEVQVVKEGSVETDQGALSRLLLVPYNSYYGGSYRANVQSGYQQLQYNVMPSMEVPCPYSNAGNIGYPSPCQQTPQVV